jgi:hypothetical protein
MERRFEEEPDPTIAVTERESRSFRRIQGGDAAKAAEDSAEDAALFQGSFGIRLQTARGTRFEKAKHSDNQEDALPPPGADAKEQNAASVKLEKPQNEKSATGITRTLFRKLLRP